MWINYMLNFWPFVLIYVYIAVILGLTVLRQLKSWTAALQRHSLKEGFFSLFTLRSSLFSHLGLFLAMTMATLADLTTADCEDAICHRTEGVYHGDLRQRVP